MAPPWAPRQRDEYSVELSLPRHNVSSRWIRCGQGILQCKYGVGLDLQLRCGLTSCQKSKRWEVVSRRCCTPSARPTDGHKGNSTASRTSRLTTILAPRLPVARHGQALRTYFSEGQLGAPSSFRRAEALTPLDLWPTAQHASNCLPLQSATPDTGKGDLSGPCVFPGSSFYGRLNPPPAPHTDRPTSPSSHPDKSLVLPKFPKIPDPGEFLVHASRGTCHMAPTRVKHAIAPCMPARNPRPRRVYSPRIAHSAARATGRTQA